MSHIFRNLLTLFCLIGVNLACWAASPPPDQRPLIVIDPGHGGQDLGATGVTGVFEKDIVLEFSKALAKKLETMGTVRVALTRDHDIFLPLDERVRIARKQNAALFISIHGDTIAATGEVRGITIYTGDDRPSDAEAARVAEAENRADSGVLTGESKLGSSINDILGDLMLRETRAHAILLAQELASRIADLVQLNRNPVRAAGFRVLRAPDVPSILIEIGYLSSKEDLNLLMSPEWRDHTTSRMAAGIAEFLNRTRGIASSDANTAPISP